jgi:hypothetical protein
MSWSMEDIDALYNGIDDGQDFAFDPAYFEDIEAKLPVFRRRTVGLGLWINLMFVLTCAIGMVSIIRAPESEMNMTYTAHRGTKKNYKTPISLVKSQTVSSESTNYKIPLPPEKQENPKILEYGAKVQPEQFEAYAPQLSLKTITPAEHVASEPIHTMFLSLISKPRQQWYSSINIGLQQPWTNSGNQVRANASLGAEAGLSRKMSQNLTVFAGVSFNWTSFDQLEIKERSKIYGFGYATYDNSYSFTGMASLGLPLSLKMRSGRHAFGPSVEFRRNLFAQIKRVQSWNGEVFKISEGITDLALLNKHSLQLGAQYEFALNATFSIGANVRCELLQQINSERFEGKVNNRPFTATVSMKAYFNK